MKQMFGFLKEQAFVRVFLIIGARFLICSNEFIGDANEYY